jgi:hypothetical protein
MVPCDTYYTGINGAVQRGRTVHKDVTQVSGMGPRNTGVQHLDTVQAHWDATLK